MKYSHPLVYVRWADSCNSDFGWTHIEDLDTRIYEIDSVGFLVDETEDALALSSHYSVDDPYKCNTILMIPKSCVLEIKELSVQGRRRSIKNGS